MGDAELIELLNDIQIKYGKREDIFLDKRGNPTDHFLQAIKSFDNLGKPEEVDNKIILSSKFF